MSSVLPHEVAQIGPLGALGTRLIVRASRLLGGAPPKVLRAVLRAAATGSRPAGYADTRAARDIVLTASAFTRGDSACLPRSIATALVCRTRGTWPSWCVGVLSSPPFTAHAWVEADGLIVDEPMDRADFSTFFSVDAPGATPRATTTPLTTPSTATHTLRKEIA